MPAFNPQFSFMIRTPAAETISTIEKEVPITDQFSGKKKRAMEIIDELMETATITKRERKVLVDFLKKISKQEPIVAFPIE